MKKLLSSLKSWYENIGSANIALISIVTVFLSVSCLLFYIHFHGISFLAPVVDMDPLWIIPLSLLISLVIPLGLAVIEALLLQVLIFFVILPLILLSPLFKAVYKLILKIHKQ